jgi:hypothetical protein
MFGAEIRIVLSGEFCIMRVVRGAVEEVRAELGRLEQRSRLYLSLGPGEKVLVSDSRALDARHAHAVAATCNRATLETIQSAAAAAGIEIAAIEPGLSALSRAVSRLPDVPDAPYLLVNLAQSATEIGVCHEGKLLLDYRPGGATHTAELGALLESHLNRLNRHVARYLRTNTVLKHVFLCGDDQAVKSAIRQFGAKSQLEIRHVRPDEIQATWKYVDDAARQTTAAALGGLLATYLPPDELDAPNLMQHIFESQREPLRPRILQSILPIAAVLVVAVGLGLVNGRQQGALDGMQAELDKLSVIDARATELRLKLMAAQSKLDELTKLADKLPARLGGATIARLGACMPSDVWLSKLELTDCSKVYLQGASYVETGVYDFVSWLQQAPGFAEVALKRTQPSAGPTGPTTTFELELALGAAKTIATKVARHE